MDIKGKKNGTEKRNRNSVSSSRSKIHSKDNSQDETRESHKDPNDPDFDQSVEKSEEINKQTKKKEIKVEPKQGVGILRNGVSFRKMGFQNIVKNHLEQIRQDNIKRGFSGEVIRVTPDCLDTLLLSAEVYIKNILEDAYILSRHSKRVTLMRKDI